MKITIIKDAFSPFENQQYEVDLSRRFEGYEAGDLICKVTPFLGEMPLQLEIAIRKNGSLAFRSWTFCGNNSYLHTEETPETFTATQEQIDTVNGLFSGRIKYEGLKIAIGKTVQYICPIDVAKEEELNGKKIYLN